MSETSARPKRKKRRFLLTAVALSTGSLLSGCGSHQGDEGSGAGETRTMEPLPLPGNPKGSVYDDGVHETDPPPEQDGPPPEEGGPQVPEEGEPEEGEPTPERRPVPLPANPKGALYDDGAYERDA